MNRKQKISSWVTLAVVGAIGVAVGIFYATKLRYETMPPKRGDIVEAVYGIGTVESEHTFVLRVAIPARVQTLHVVEGLPVAKGDPIATLDSGVTLRSSIAGQLTKLLVGEGETVNAGQTLAVIQDLKARYIRLLLDQESALRVRAGQPVKIALESVRGIRYDGVVRFVYPSEGQFVIRIDSDELPPEILPGMAADLAIEVGRREDGLLVPLRAVQNGRITLLRDGKRTKEDVELGVLDGNWAEVVTGNIRLDDQLILPPIRD